MKVIELLNKIANGDKEIKDKYELKINTYLHCHYVPECLNDEVEIIEEDKKIKRIQSCGDNLYSEYIGQWLVNKENYTEYDELLMNKINEIIDKINNMEVK